MPGSRLCAHALLRALVLAASLGAAGGALAHPHVFAESKMEIVGDGQAHLTAIRNVWRMDELFSTSVVMDFDKNGNGILDEDELQAIGDTVKESIAEWNFYTSVRTVDGKPVKMLPPEAIRALYQDGQLLLFFEMKPEAPVDLKAQGLEVANFDETFFTAFDEGDDGFQLVDLPASCSRSVTVPDEDEAAKQWMASIATLGPDEKVPDDGIDYAKILATRADVKCG